MTVYVTAFILSFCAIFMKGFSQQNTQYKRKMLMIPTSWVHSTFEMMTIGVFANHYIDNGVWASLPLAFVIGTGGGLGCILSLDIHAWITKKIYKWDKEG